MCDTLTCMREVESEATSWWALEKFMGKVWLRQHTAQLRIQIRSYQETCYLFTKIR